MEYLVTSELLPQDGELLFDYTGKPEESSMFWNGERLGESRGAYYVPLADGNKLRVYVEDFSVFVDGEPAKLIDTSSPEEKRAYWLRIGLFAPVVIGSYVFAGLFGVALVIAWAALLGELESSELAAIPKYSIFVVAGLVLAAIGYFGLPYVSPIMQAIGGPLFCGRYGCG